jgi:hypothetical protein
MGYLRAVIRSVGVLIAVVMAWQPMLDICEYYQYGVTAPIVLSAASLLGTSVVLLLPWHTLKSPLVLALLILAFIACGYVNAYYLLGGLMWAGMHGASSSESIAVVYAAIVFVIIVNFAVLIGDFIRSVRKDKKIN